MIIDNPQVLRDCVHEHRAASGHSQAEAIVSDPAVLKWVDRYAEEFAALVDPEWETMINDPKNRWYKEGQEYKNLFSSVKPAVDHGVRLGEKIPWRSAGAGAAHV